MGSRINRIIPTLVVRPDGLVFYDLWDGYRSRNKGSFTKANFSQQFGVDLDFDKPEKKSTYRGVLTDSGRKRLSWYINLLIASAKWKDCYNSKTKSWFKFKVNFITLTLSAAQGNLSDKFIKKAILSRWIDTMRSAHGLNNYVWRAERQMNGNIHFHITTDTYLPYDRICSVWNHYQGEFHFIEKFQEANESKMPNSTDVHSVQKINNLAAYMVKYMSKSPEDHLNQLNAKRKKDGQAKIDPERHPWRAIPLQPKWNDPIEGSVWDASLKLKRHGKLSFSMSSVMFDLSEKLINDYPERCFSTDYCMYVDMPDDVKKSLLPPLVYSDYLDYLNSLNS